MGDLLDIFGEEPAPPTKGASVPTHELRELAVDASVAFDCAEEARGRYRAKLDELAKQHAVEVEALRVAADAADAKLATYKAALETAMRELKITEIEVEDRPAIRLRAVKGRKRPVTKGILEDILGKPHAQEVWQKVPNNPDSYDVLFQPRSSEPSN